MLTRMMIVAIQVCIIVACLTRAGMLYWHR